MNVFSNLRYKVSNWWNKIDYVEIECSLSQEIIRIPRKYVSIGFETEDNKVLTLKDIKKAGYNISSIYPRLALYSPEYWTLYVPKDITYQKQGWFEYPLKKLNYNQLNNSYFQKLLCNQDIKYIGCYGKWYRSVLGFFKTKPYVEIYRSNWVLNVPWESKELFNVGTINSEQAVYCNKNKSMIEIRWTKESIKVFDSNNKKYYTYKDLIVKP